jgi:RNA polymerase sigma-70 factor (ECF subfamily)
VPGSDSHRAIEAVFRIESPKLIAGLTRLVRDVGRAEELAQDALVAALEQWPKEGVPDNPGAWLMAAAKHRAVDALRKGSLVEKKHEEVARGEQLKEGRMPDFETALDEDVGDDLLRLVLIACHPVLSTDSRVTLTLRLLGGLSTEEIARAFLTPETTIQQRVVRAKRTLAEQRVAFEVPKGAELAERLESVLEVIYLVFNEGYSATAGDDLMRPGLCEDAMRLGRILAGLVPGEPEVHGLVALMEIQASRAAARVAPSGEPVLLNEQNRALWDHLLIRHGLRALERAQELGGQSGPYVLQASIAACHARAKTFEETDWALIVGLYGGLAELSPSPVIELNRAVALSMLMGPEAGLTIVDALRDDPVLKGYHLLPSVRADLLIKLGRNSEARVELDRAIALTKNESERKLLIARRDRL